MAYNINSAPIVIDSDDEFYDSDEERDHVMGPVTEPVPLQDAISSASKAILVKTLLEICEHNKGSKELATSLLAPPHAPSGPRGTKRKASPTGTTPTGAMVTKEIDRICENCRRKFGDTVQITKDCRYHPGTKSVDSGHKVFEMIDWDTASELDMFLDDDEYQAGTQWSCCYFVGDAAGCKVREHLVLAGEVARVSSDRYL